MRARSACSRRRATAAEAGRGTEEVVMSVGMVTEALRRQLEERRARLSASIEVEGPDADLVRLLRQVDSALGRLGTPDYARCLVCDGHVVDEDLRHNPLME